eukprot:1942972-Alexandrium_andersonii.AAC.1
MSDFAQHSFPNSSLPIGDGSCIQPARSVRYWPAPADFSEGHHNAGVVCHSFRVLDMRLGEADNPGPSSSD